ncbi:MAG: hypothetical protein ACYTEZ_06535 [Planctomycetota bacterium]|jgi:hypothetical protein
MRGVGACVFLAAIAAAAEPGFKEVFDPFHPAWPAGGSRRRIRRAAFDRAVAAHGLAAALRACVAFEPAIAEVEKRLDKDYAAYRKAAEKWWGWRRKYERDHQRKYGRPPAEYPTPPAINRPFLDREEDFEKSRGLKMKERVFQRWAMERCAELLPALDGPPKARAEAALAAGLRHRHPRQRLRCARLLVAFPQPRPRDAALARERHAGVLAALVEAGGPEAAVAPFLRHAAWPVRAGAIRALRRHGSREAAGLLLGALERERGRLRDDAADALRALTGRKLGSDPAAWRRWWEETPGWSPPPRPRAEVDRTVSPGVFSDGLLTCLGLATSSRAVIYCIEASSRSLWEAVRPEIVRSVASLPDGTRFGIVLYGRGPALWRKKMAHADAGTRASAVAFLQDHVPVPGADLHRGLTAALDLAARGREPAAADTVFLGAFSGQRTGLYEFPLQVTMEILAQNALLGLRIHAAGASAGRDAYYLQTLCRQFEGTHKAP